jgi:hypothetical protein
MIFYVILLKKIFDNTYFFLIERYRFFIISVPRSVGRLFFYHINLQFKKLINCGKCNQQIWNTQKKYVFKHLFWQKKQMFETSIILIYIDLIKYHQE